jgi:phosphocarrier protein HPr
MVTKEIVVINYLGIHARPASMIVKTATKFHSDIHIEKGGTKASAKSIMSVMMLAAAHNTKVIITASGEDEEEAVRAVHALFCNRFNED